MNLIALLCVLLAAAIVGMVVMVALLDWGGHLGLAARLSLCTIAAGLVLAGPSRLVANPGPGPGDLLFLAGLFGLMLAVYGRHVAHRIDWLDGRRDGRVALGGVVQVFDPRRRRRPY